MTEDKRWNTLTEEQLQGADYSLRILRTSVLIRGQALALVDELILDIRDEMRDRG